MTLGRRRGGRPPRDVLGDWALTCGVVAVLFVFVPVIGDLIAMPAALGAVALAAFGVVREHRGGPLNTGRTLAGGLLGAAALLLVGAMIAATGGFG